MYPKALIAILLAFLCFSSCKKSDTSSTDVYPDKIVLNPIKVSGNMATISWSKLAIPLLEYNLVRVTDTTNPYEPARKVIYIDKNASTYTDTLPYTSYAQYYVVAVLAATNNSGTNARVSSNTQTCSRTDMDFINFLPMDALMDKDNNRLFIYDSIGNIVQYNLQTQKVTKQIFTNAASGYCTLGTYNGAEELYVPRSDGWVFIYDANTLNKTDQIYVGNSLSAIVYDNTILYITSYSDKASGYLVSYNRGTKTVISMSTKIAPITLKKIPGTNTELIGEAIGYGFILYHFYLNNGILDTVKVGGGPDNLTGGEVEFLPTGTAFICGLLGEVYDTSLNEIAYITEDAAVYHYSFAFDNSNRIMYSNSYDQFVYAYSMDNYQFIKRLNAKGYPLKVFYNNSKLYAVSTSYQSYNIEYTINGLPPSYGSTFVESF